MKDKDQKHLEVLYENLSSESKRSIVEKGNYVSEQWTNEKGQLHRVDGPALTKTAKDDGRLVAQRWKINDRFHRLDGPAWIIHSNNSQKWFINNHQLSEEEFNNHPLVKAHKLKEKLKSGSSSDEENVLADMFT